MRAVIQERDEGADGVTVAIPCYNHAAYLSEAIESALLQTVPPLEVIVVDDGSTEDLPWYRDVRYIRVSNRGLPGARNTALMNARGRAFLPLDADDWIDQTYIEKTLPLLEDVVCVGLQEHGERRQGTYPVKPRMRQLTVDRIRKDNRLFYCALFRTSLLREVGGYNGRMIHGYEDWDLWIDLIQRGVKFSAVDEILFHYRTSETSMLMDTEANWKQWCLDEMARHHGYS